MSTFIGVAAAALLLAAGCGSSTTSSQSSPSPSAQTSSSRTFQISTPDGQVSLSLDGQLPPSWPSEFPVPPNATAAGSGSLGGQNSTGNVAVYSTPMAAPDAFSFYTSHSSLTTTGAKTAGAGSAYVGSVQVTAPYTGSVTVASRSETTYIVVVLKTT